MMDLVFGPERTDLQSYIQLCIVVASSIRTTFCFICGDHAKTEF